VVNVGSILKSDNVQNSTKGHRRRGEFTISHEIEETMAEYSTLGKEQVTWRNNLVLSHIGDGH